MSTTSTALSQTLQSITTIKIRELSRQKSAFNARKAEVLTAVDELGQKDREKVKFLLTSIAKIQGSNTYKSIDEFYDYELDPFLGGLSLSNIRNYLRQSEYDPSVSPTLLSGLEKSLRQLLDQKSERFEFADLYSQLLTEWLKSDATTASESAAVGDSPVDESEGFEFVERQKERLKQLSEKFESVVFTPLETDVAAIEDLLSELFPTEEAKAALSKLRTRIRTFGERMAADAKPFSQDTLIWVIRGLLQSDLLSDAKKNTLEAFLKDDVVLLEIADVLNMRFVDLESWTWDADDGIPVEPRRQLNGKYRVVMDEDVLQSIFLHYISTTWAIEFHAALMDIVSNLDVWQWTERMPLAEIEKREYFLGRHNFLVNEGVTRTRQQTYQKDFFMCQLPSAKDTSIGADGYDDDEGEAASGKISRKPSGAGTKQQLLRTIGTEVIINRFLHGQVAVVQSDLQWFATSISHQTVDTICKFFGVPAVWLQFFQRYLAAPLRMVGLEGEQGQVRIRKRGVPIGHVFQKLFGELIVFSMDLAVNQETRMLLYRLHDDLWLCGEPAKCAKAWVAMERCAKVMGVDFNRAKTGSAYINNPSGSPRDAQIAATLPKGRVILGFLELDAVTGNWVIDRTQVDAHAEQLQKQLGECNSIFSWVQTWNSCIGRFFNYTLGQPANCFGRAHVDMILKTHQRIQEKLFRVDTSDASDDDNGIQRAASRKSSVTDHLKHLISARFNVSNIPDAFIYYPEMMGGLGLRNPFIPFLVIRDQVIESSEDVLDRCLMGQRKTYMSAKKYFKSLSHRERQRRLDAFHDNEYGGKYTSAFGKPKGKSWSGPVNGESDFLPWEDFLSYRISSSYDLKDAYCELLSTPGENGIQPTRDVEVDLAKLSGSNPELAWDSLGSERRWLVQLYAKESFERFGGLALVDQGALPMGVLKVVRGRKVVWQSVL